MTPRTPTTAAGRKHLQWLLAGDDVFPEDALAAILAIEAEARAPLDVDRLARALHQLQSGPHRDRNPVAGEGRDTCDLDAAELAREYEAQP